MLFEIEVNGRTRRVTVERVPNVEHAYRVDIDGRPRRVDAVPLGDTGVSILLPDEGGTSLTVDVAPAGHGEFLVRAGGRVVAASVDGGRSRRGGHAEGPAGEQRLVAPMPGKVLRVLAGPGDEVEPRQPLVVVEAMKMENEMTAARAGRVREVHVTEGMSVEAGRLLVIVE